MKKVITKLKQYYRKVLIDHIYNKKNYNWMYTTIYKLYSEFYLSFLRYWVKILHYSRNEVTTLLVILIWPRDLAFSIILTWNLNKSSGFSSENLLKREHPKTPVLLLQTFIWDFKFNIKLNVIVIYLSWSIKISLYFHTVITINKKMKIYLVAFAESKSSLSAKPNAVKKSCGKLQKQCQKISK